MSAFPVDAASHYAIVNMGEPWHDWRLSASPGRVYTQHGESEAARWMFQPAPDGEGFWQLTSEDVSKHADGELFTCKGETDFGLMAGGSEDAGEPGSQSWAFRTEDDDVGGVSILNSFMGDDWFLGLDPLALLTLRMGKGGLDSYRWNVTVATGKGCTSAAVAQTPTENPPYSSPSPYTTTRTSVLPGTYTGTQTVTEIEIATAGESDEGGETGAPFVSGAAGWRVMGGAMVGVVVMVVFGVVL